MTEFRSGLVLNVNNVLLGPIVRGDGRDETWNELLRVLFEVTLKTQASGDQDGTHNISKDNICCDAILLRFLLFRQRMFCGFHE